MTPQEWFDKTYNLENEALLQIVQNVGFGKIELVIHEGKITKIFPTPEIRVNNPRQLGDLLRKTKYLGG